MAVASLRCAIGVGSAGNASEDCRRDLPVLFLLGKHFERDDLDRIIRSPDVLHGLNLTDPKVDRLFPKIVYSDDKDRSAVRLELARSGTNQHQ
jgi:hypothetical protein